MSNNHHFSDLIKKKYTTLYGSYLDTRFTQMNDDFIFNKFGITCSAPIQSRSLSETEIHIRTQLGIVLALTEEHIEYWIKIPQAKRRLQNLQEMRRLIYSLLDAILGEDNSLILRIIDRVTLSTLILAFQIPSIKSISKSELPDSAENKKTISFKEREIFRNKVGEHMLVVHGSLLDIIQNIKRQLLDQQVIDPTKSFAMIISTKEKELNDINRKLSKKTKDYI